MTNPRIADFAFPTVAIIRKGGPKRKKTVRRGNETKEIEVVGEDLNDRFRITWYAGTEEYRQAFLATNPDAQQMPDGSLIVRTIHAMTPFAKTTDSLQVFNEAYQAGRMVLRATDHQVLVRRDPLTGQYLVRDGRGQDGKPEAWEPGQPVTYQRDGKTYSLPVKTAIRLRLWLPALARMVVLELKSTSYYDAINLRQQFGAIQLLADMLNGGIAGGIPFRIFRREQEVTWNRPDGGAQRVKKWLVNVEVDPRWVAAATQRMSSFAMTGQQIAGLLQPAAIEGQEDPGQEELNPAGEEPIEGDYYDEEPPAIEEPPQPEPAADAEPEDELAAELRYAPAELQDRIRDNAKKVMDRAQGSPTESESLRKVVKQALEQILASIAVEHGDTPTSARGTLQFFLTGFRSLDKGSGGCGIEYVLAIKSWLQLRVSDDGSGDYVINPMSEREARAAYLHAKGIQQ